MLPEEKAREKIDKQLTDSGWKITHRREYVPNDATAVKEALMRGNTESDYLLFVDNKAIAVVEAKREENPLDEDVQKQAERYAVNPQSWYGLWFEDENLIPLVYMANGRKIYFKNMLIPDSDYEELSVMHSPKKMLQIIGKKSDYGALSRLEKRGLRDCQYEAELELEKSLKMGLKKNLAVLATGAGKTYLACLASYRLLTYTTTKKILFLVDRNNLARQTSSECSRFDLTENQQAMGSLYTIKRLKKEGDIKADIVISTIQKFFAFLTGQAIQEIDEDIEDEQFAEEEEETSEDMIRLGDELTLPPDYFQFIIVDECHRSIYGKWQAVLNYFTDAKILGLTATPKEETDAFFNHHTIQMYSFDDSVVDRVNVPPRIYRIVTEITEHGGTIKQGTDVVDTSKQDGSSSTYTAARSIEYQPVQLDHTVINRNQIKEVLLAYKDAIYRELFPNREKRWEYIPKTLIFAKNDNHATEIVSAVEELFGKEFEHGEVPKHYVQKITYSAGDSDALIQQFNTDKAFRIAVTVTLVATGTDIKPLEVVLFMKDVQSDVLYTQMKGRGCRTIQDEKLREVTPNADTKECYYIVDAVGVTEHEKYISSPTRVFAGRGKTLSLEHLLERLSHNELSDENMILLRDYCSTITRRYEDNPLFERHLDYFIKDYGFAPKHIADNIHRAFTDGRMVEYQNPSRDNSMRMGLISCLVNNVEARKQLVALQKGYYITATDEDRLLDAGFVQETAASYLENFERYLEENKDRIEALRILYNSEEIVITHTMLVELKDRLLAENNRYGVDILWKNYRTRDTERNVEELDPKANVNILTNLIQIVRYAYKRIPKLTSITKGYGQRLSLYCGQRQRTLTDDQIELMKQIAEYVIYGGAISVNELNELNTDLWRKAVNEFTAPALNEEIQAMTNIILRVA